MQGKEGRRGWRSCTDSFTDKAKETRRAQVGGLLLSSGPLLGIFSWLLPRGRGCLREKRNRWCPGWWWHQVIQPSRNHWSSWCSRSWPVFSVPHTCPLWGPLCKREDPWHSSRTSNGIHQHRANRGSSRLGLWPLISTSSVILGAMDTMELQARLTDATGKGCYKEPSYWQCTLTAMGCTKGWSTSPLLQHANQRWSLYKI